MMRRRIVEIHLLILLFSCVLLPCNYNGRALADLFQHRFINILIVLAYSSSPSFLIWYFRRRMKEFLKNKLRFKSFICFKEIELR